MMKSISINEYDKNFFKEIGTTWGILTAGDKNTGCNGMTVSWGGAGVLWNKNVAFVFVRKSRYTHDFMEKSEGVTLSFLDAEYKAAKALFGSKSGRDMDKFKEASITPEYDSDKNCYYVKEADTVFVMKKLYKTEIPLEGLDEGLVERFYPTKDIHDMYVCEIVDILVK